MCINRERHAKPDDVDAIAFPHRSDLQDLLYRSRAYQIADRGCLLHSIAERINRVELETRTMLSMNTVVSPRSYRSLMLTFML